MSFVEGMIIFFFLFRYGFYLGFRDLGWVRVRCKYTGYCRRVGRVGRDCLVIFWGFWFVVMSRVIF